MPEFTHGKPVAWSDLAVDVVTDKIPPGWYLGCGWPMEKYKDACEDWKILTSLDDDKKRCAALRFRLKGPVKEFMDLHREILMEEYDSTEGEGDGRRTVRRRRPIPGHETEWSNFFEIMRKNFGDHQQKQNKKHFEAFLCYRRRRNQNLQEYVAEHNRLYDKAAEQGLKLEGKIRGYWFLRQGLLTDEQERWILGGKVDNDWALLDIIQKQAMNMPESMSGAAHFTDFNDPGAFWTKDPSEKITEVEPSSLNGVYFDGWTVQEWRDNYWELWLVLDNMGLSLIHI